MGPCDESRSRIFLYLDDELRGRELTALESHVRGCSACQRAVAEERRFLNELRSRRPICRAPMELRSRVEGIVQHAFSASHVAYSSIRMEPQYMILGHAAGVAARLAVESGKAVQDIDVSALMATLRKEGAILESQPNPQAPALQLFPPLIRP